MKHSFFRQCAALAVVALAAAGCTMKDQDPPPVAGPSEFGQSIVIAIAPDILQQDGASQSVITITARGPNGEPITSLPLRAEIRVNGTPTDFGTLSARNLVTSGDGRATLVYTAPPPIPGFAAVDEFTIVDIGITPLGTDFGNSTTRFASLRLVPRGIIVPPDGLQPVFTFAPIAPVANQNVLFDASGSRSPANNPIVSFTWDFGDGSTGSGQVTTHEFRAPGTYVVTLTVTDGVGRSRQASQSVNVAPGVNPTARFTFSPTEPTVGTSVNFNGRESTPAPGRTIMEWLWDFGDGSGGSGPQTAHTYGRAGVYTVTLTVTDDAGRTHTTSTTVEVD